MHTTTWGNHQHSRCNSSPCKNEGWLVFRCIIPCLLFLWWSYLMRQCLQRTALIHFFVSGSSEFDAETRWHFVIFDQTCPSYPQDSNCHLKILNNSHCWIVQLSNVVSGDAVLEWKQWGNRGRIWIKPQKIGWWGPAWRQIGGMSVRKGQLTDR